MPSRTGLKEMWGVLQMHEHDELCEGLEHDYIICTLQIIHWCQRKKFKIWIEIIRLKLTSELR
jgi:hypothetical protein